MRPGKVARMVSLTYDVTYLGQKCSELMRNELIKGHTNMQNKLQGFFGIQKN